MQYVAAYGSPKDIAVYNQLPIPHDKVFILGKSKKQTQNTCTVSKIYYIIFFIKLK